MVVLNVLRVVRCVDESRSFIKWTSQDHRPDLAGQYRQTTRLALDATQVPTNAGIFRIEGSLVELIVTEKVKNAMERAGCVGAKFVELPT